MKVKSKDYYHSQLYHAGYSCPIKNWCKEIKEEKDFWDEMNEIQLKENLKGWEKDFIERMKIEENKFEVILSDIYNARFLAHYYDKPIFTAAQKPMTTQEKIEKLEDDIKFAKGEIKNWE